MSTKRMSSGVLFIVLMGAILLTTALLFKDGPRGADLSVETRVQESMGAREQSPISITYTYDDAGRLVGADYGAGQGITYTYDAAGNLLQQEVYGMATPTPTATTTPTPTLTPTATATPTPSPTPTATEMPKVYLPVLFKGW